MIENSLFANKTILIISPQSWQKNFVSKHHYATKLADLGAKVYFLNPPNKSAKIFNVNKNLHVVNFKHTKGINKLPAAISGLMVKREIQRLEKLLSVTFDIIWNFELSRFYNLRFVKDKIKILHIVDLNLMESSNLMLALKSYQLFFGTSDFIVEKFGSTAYKFKINHGYNIELLALDKIQKENNSSRIKVAYLGNLSIDYLDWNLIYDVIVTNPSIEFHFIGPIKDNARSDSGEILEFQKKSLQLENCFIHEAISSGEINAELSKYDLLLLCYKANEYLEQLANPHKVLEYIGTGKPIVATYTYEYRDSNLIEMASNREDFIALFNHVSGNLSKFSTQNLCRSRIKFAKENSYQNQIKRIENYIQLIL
ncbi:MAG: hypothetical protein H6599_09440 [Flavobacteriales bacterium]|nr:hypothetical protein [Flavobacteriales bacterium]